MSVDVQLRTRDFAGCLIVTTDADICVELAGRIRALAMQLSRQDIVLNLRGGCQISRAAATDFAELRNVLEVNGGSLRIAVPGEQTPFMDGDDGSGLSGCVYHDLADALEVSIAVRERRASRRTPAVGSPRR